MNEHPIEGLMNTAMNNLRDMIDVNTVIGETIELENGTAIVPISKVCFGFAAGGSEFNAGTPEQFKKQGLDEEAKYSLPFGGRKWCRRKHSACWIFSYNRKLC